PFQPLEFLKWLASRISGSGAPCSGVLFEPDGSLTIKARTKSWNGSLRWAPPSTDAAAGRRFEGIEGIFMIESLDESVISLLAGSLNEIVAKYNPVFLEWGPAENETVCFSPESLGEMLKTRLTPGRTLWGDFLAGDFSFPSKNRMEIRFSDIKNTGGEIVIELSLDTGDDAGRPGRRNLKFSVIKDSRDAAAKKKLEFQIERIVGFSLGRLLGRNPEIKPAETVPSKDLSGICATCSEGAAVPDYLNKYYSLVRHEAFIRRWDAGDKWRRFFYPASRCIVNLFKLGAADAIVIHESLECVLNEPPWMPPDSTFFSNDRKTLVGEFWQRNNLLVTDLMADDVVSGGSMRKLESALGEAASLPGCSSVVIVSGCLPNVMGDNPVPAMRRLEKKTDARLYWIGNTNDFSGYTARLIRDRLEKVAPQDAPRDPLGVAVIGEGSAEENSELLGLLSQIGLNPLGIILPDVGFERFKKAARASLFVWANQSALKDAAELAFTGLPVKLMRPDAPVGLIGTLKWLETIVKNAGSGAIGSLGLDRIRYTFNVTERIAGLKKRTGIWTAAFVAGIEEIDALIDTRPVHAFSVMDTLVEMGFRVRFLAFGNEAGYTAQKEFIKSSGLEETVEFVFFEDKDSLDSLLRGKDIGIVFSNFTADPRAVSAGKGVFCENHFEMGIEGFFRTAERLLGLCERRPLSGFENYLDG
ncbi:MAG: hypothetical protein FJ088_05480, partial [Deltaproteobacteria bacterium]|nr:hypothetical protein [Deltaproteobacteria bacterium]